MISLCYFFFELKVGLHERLRQARITKYSVCHTFVTVVFTVPHLVFIYSWFQQEQKIKSVFFHSALLWSWVLVGMKLAASAFFFHRVLHYDGSDGCGGCFSGLVTTRQNTTKDLQMMLKTKKKANEDVETSQSIPLQNI